MDRTEIASEAWRTVEEIKNGEVYREFRESRDRLLGPEGPVALREAFERAKAAHAKASAYGRTDARAKAAAAALAAAKDALYATPDYRRYAAALKALNAVLGGIADGLNAILETCRAGQKTGCGRRSTP